MHQYHHRPHHHYIPDLSIHSTANRWRWMDGGEEEEEGEDAADEGDGEEGLISQMFADCRHMWGAIAEFFQVPNNHKHPLKCHNKVLSRVLQIIYFTIIKYLPVNGHLNDGDQRQRDDQPRKKTILIYGHFAGCSTTTRSSKATNGFIGITSMRRQTLSCWVEPVDGRNEGMRMRECLTLTYSIKF